MGNYAKDSNDQKCNCDVVNISKERYISIVLLVE